MKIGLLANSGTFTFYLLEYVLSLTNKPKNKIKYRFLSTQSRLVKVVFQNHAL